MKKFKFYLFSLLALATITLTNCFHITEDVTFKKDGSGAYKLNFDMSEVKSMMDMVKGMQSDSAKSELGGIGEGDQMTQMGEQLTSVSNTLQGVKGISNVLEIKDTATYQFGYSFDFASTEALNKALKIIGKEKYDSNNPEVFKYDGKSFKRLAAGDFGAEIKKQMEQTGEGEEESGLGEQKDMMKMFFADMTYKQNYHFERTIKKSSNSLSEISEDKQTVSINLKPFSEEATHKNGSVVTEIKLK